nr:hypothetical protein [Streptomyces brasiliensis]
MPAGITSRVPAIRDATVLVTGDDLGGRHATLVAGAHGGGR